MRTEFELWLIVEENYDRKFHLGLCYYLRDLYWEEIIIWEEYHFLSKRIAAYGYRRFDRETGYFWNPRDIKPRKMFIQKQLLKCIRSAA